MNLAEVSATKDGNTTEAVHRHTVKPANQHHIVKASLTYLDKNHSCNAKQKQALTWTRSEVIETEPHNAKPIFCICNWFQEL